MELQINEVQEVYQGLGLLVQRHNDELSVASSVFLARLNRKLKPEVEVFEQERDRLILKHGSPQEDGSFGVRVGTEAMIRLSQEMYELRQSVAAVEVEPLMVCYDEEGNATIRGVNLERIEADIIFLLSPLLVEA